MFCQGMTVLYHEFRLLRIIIYRLTPATLLSVQNCLPRCHTFKGYGQLKNYWRNNVRIFNIYSIYSKLNCFNINDNFSVRLWATSTGKQDCLLPSKVPFWWKRRRYLYVSYGIHKIDKTRSYPIRKLSWCQQGFL